MFECHQTWQFITVWNVAVADDAGKGSQPHGLRTGKMGARKHENVCAECCSPLGQVVTSTTGRCPRFYTVIQQNAFVTLQKAVIAPGKGPGSTKKKKKI
jgi:hypothetical protein